MTKYSYTDQPYLAELFRYIAEHPHKPGTINHVMIEHDDWCPALLGTGYCICRPTVRPPKREELRRLRQLERQARKRRTAAARREGRHGCACPRNAALRVNLSPWRIDSPYPTDATAG